ncbi:hypothetical protein [Kordiimonas aquimaris]|nr:hypothetical protein [Kordiimonas aquimaris]
MKNFPQLIVTILMVVLPLSISAAEGVLEQYEQDVIAFVSKQLKE